MHRPFALTLALALLWPTAARAGDEAPPLSTDLAYHHVTWLLRGTAADGPRIVVEAPKGWIFRRTPDGEGRFHDPTRTFWITVSDPLKDPAMRMQMESQVEAVEDGQDYHLVTRSIAVDHHDGSAVGTLKYSYTSAGTTRLYVTKYVGYLAHGLTGRPMTAYLGSVTGRPQDDDGLAALVHHVVTTVSEGD